VSKPRLLDLFCGEGGAGMGYHLAGFDVVGVDHLSQHRYPFQFFRADCVELPDWFLAGFDAIHASPPCQFGTEMRFAKNAKGAAGHLNLIPWTREMLLRSGKPYVIENVRAVRAHLRDPISLHGQMFDLHMVTSSGQRFDLDRERLFETNWPLVQPWHPGPSNPIANVFGGHLRNRAAKHGGRLTRDFVGEDKPALARQMMQMPWATMGGMSEAIPPAYCEFVGEELLTYLQSRRAAA